MKGPSQENACCAPSIARVPCCPRHPRRAARQGEHGTHVPRDPRRLCTGPHAVLPRFRPHMPDNFHSTLVAPSAGSWEEAAAHCVFPLNSETDHGVPNFGHRLLHGVSSQTQKRPGKELNSRGFLSVLQRPTRAHSARFFSNDPHSGRRAMQAARVTDVKIDLLPVILFM